MATPNTGIPYVPEGTQDPAAGLNLALNVIDALLQSAVIDMDLTAPPGSPSDGDLHIVAGGATGAWDGQDNNLARYVAEGDFWQFYVAGTQVHIVLNKDDGGLYAWSGSAWVAPIAAGSVAASAVSYNNATSGLAATDAQAAIDELAAAPGGAPEWGDITGTLSDQTDLQAALDAKASASGVPIITESTATRDMDPDDAGCYHRFTSTGAKTATFDDGDSFTAAQEFHITNRSASGNLTLTAAGSMTLNPPKGGTLVLEPGDTVTVKMVDTDEADVFGSTEAA